MKRVLRIVRWPVRYLYIQYRIFGNYWRFNKNFGFLYDGLRQLWYRMFLGNLGSRSNIQNVKMGYPQNIFIGNHVSIGHGVFINATAEVHIGDNTMISTGCVLHTAGHNLADADLHESVEAKPISIGSNCWIASNSTVLGGVTVGDRAIVGAGSVVTRDVEPGMVVAGIPAKVIKSRPVE